MVPRQKRNSFVPRIRTEIVTACVIVLLTMTTGIANAQQQSSATAATQPRPVSLAHLYWHFLAYQYHLDTKATEQEAQGRDGSRLRKGMQAGLNMSDAEFVPIRLSSKRLIGKVKTLDAKAANVIAGGKTATSPDQLKALTAEREADISAEVGYIQQTLGPVKTAAFERYLTQLFSPKQIKIQLQPQAVQPAPAAVQP